MTILDLLEGVVWFALGLFSLHSLWMLSAWARLGRQTVAPAGRFRTLPSVTVQLPVFNERYVVGRLLEAVAQFDYPRDRLEIQILDDSTDDTTALIAERVKNLQAEGFCVQHQHRTHRIGFKAGALAEGLVSAGGEFLALFDADFVPTADFLHRTIHYFTDPRIGMVQTRWGHLNRNDSFLTRAQALMLDGHFLIEQLVRSRAGLFFNFNGSAGVWRKAAILDAGGWQADTLAEDLDLSYRAQLRGWRFRYLPDVVVPAELPTEMISLKIQHQRWAQGTTQAAIKLLPNVLRSRLPLAIKLEACFHFAHWWHYPLGILISILILPQLMVAAPMGIGGIWSGLAGFLLLTTTALFYLASERHIGMPWWRLLLDMPILMAVGVGLALNNSRAIWKALRGAPASFDRTPKYHGRSAGPPPAGYRARPAIARWWWTEVALGMYVCAALGYATAQACYPVVPFLLPLSTGFLYAGLSSLAPQAPVR